MIHRLEEQDSLSAAVIWTSCNFAFSLGAVSRRNLAKSAKWVTPLFLNGIPNCH